MNRPLEKILYDFEAEPMNEPMWKTFTNVQINYRKREHLLSTFFKCTLILYLLCMISNLVVGVFNL